ncbi:MAG: single-stranded-DNA-specific exonuclease RecJ [bacterium]|nr:single-stranded-DNA-specific exonuclease RecJ [bacterium]
MSSTLSKRWLLPTPAPQEVLRRYRGMSPVLAQVLYKRGFEDPNDAHRFVYANDDQQVSFPLKGINKKHLDKAVGRIRTAIRLNELIAVYGDFDADGVTSTTLLTQALRVLGANVTPYIPHRIDEGYGLNTPALRELARRGIKLVITVDCGIRSLQEVKDGKAAGLDIIVTDHHSIGADIDLLRQEAYAVINPKQEVEFEPLALAGVGVAYLLASTLFRVHLANLPRGKANGGMLRPDDLLDLVAIGTVADLMPLNKMENRILVRRGLAMLNQSKRLGLRALLEVAGVQLGSATAQTIGFALGPRINAAGRLDNAMVAYELLAAQSEEIAREFAEKLQALNTKRQDITRAAQETIKTRLDAEHDVTLPLIFASDASFEPGIVGLVAGRLTEEFFRPTVVMEEGEHESRASCRSIPQFDITSALDQCADLLVRHGGHALAAGFTVVNENIPALRERLMSIAQRELVGQQLLPTLEIDAEVQMRDLSIGLVKELNLLEPCGNSNPQPLFAMRDLHVDECRTVGKDGKHLKLKVSRPGHPQLDAIGFNLGGLADQMPECIDLAFHLEINEWNGRHILQANVQDVHPAGAPQPAKAFSGRR